MSRYSARSFIKDRINLIDNNDFYTLFEEARHTLMDDQRRELIKLLDSAEINYLDHMTAINANLFQRSSRRIYDIPSNIQIIEHHAFAYSSVAYCNIAEGCKKLDKGCFQGSSLEELHLPKSIKTIGSLCFADINEPIIINYAGTCAEWNSIIKETNWFTSIESHLEIYVKCRNGVITEVANK